MNNQKRSIENARQSFSVFVKQLAPQSALAVVNSRDSGTEWYRGNIVFQADIADAARKIEQGARAAVKVEIHSSFMADADKTADVGKERDRKPV
jgi:hypothetical protein